MGENYNKKQSLYNQKMNIFYYDIAVSIPLRQCFTYKFDTKIKKGTRVAVPFGKRVLVGIIVRNIQKPDALDSKSTIKSILNIQDSETVFEKPLFDSIIWASEYYQHPIGEVFNTFIPTELRKVDKKTIKPIGGHSEYTVKESDKKFELTPDQESSVKKLSKVKTFSPSLLYGVTGSLTLALTLPLFGVEGVGVIGENDSNAAKFRLMWIENPTSEATVGWVQKSGEPGIVHYGKADQQRKHHLYGKTQSVHSLSRIPICRCRRLET